MIYTIRMYGKTRNVCESCKKEIDNSEDSCKMRILRKHRDWNDGDCDDCITKGVLEEEKKEGCIMTLIHLDKTQHKTRRAE